MRRPGIQYLSMFDSLRSIGGQRLLNHASLLQRQRIRVDVLLYSAAVSAARQATTVDVLRLQESAVHDIDVLFPVVGRLVTDIVELTRPISIANGSMMAPCRPGIFSMKGIRF